MKKQQSSDVKLHASIAEAPGLASEKESQQVPSHESVRTWRDWLKGWASWMRFFITNTANC